ncbi:mitochondrial intermediate peptidase [Diabrotica virgifera virgifera]|uniref:Peptidase M3A/M3B catalytic domain-containing protein n=1 Tax=Diabrotica virgifera virgifera TaxID=50390 RepID=A0ABM5KZZ8_DIAVI|nr:mitochondrial intermediate peptidase [Diabrotica virgifera virgifera]
MNSLLWRNYITKSFTFVRSHQRRGVSIWSPLAEAFNSRPTYKFQYHRNNGGLFGVSELTTANGFNIIEDMCIRKTDRLIEEAVNPHRQKKMVEIFDEMSDSLCQVADLAEFIRLAHPDESYRLAAENACCAVSGVVEKLNTNIELYKALKQAVKSDIVKNTPLDKHVGELFLIDFEQCGIHLPDNERNKVVNLTNNIFSLGQHFVTNSSTPRVIKKSVLPKNVRNILDSDGDSILVSGLYTDSTDPLAREMAYRIFLHPDRDQDQILNALLEARNELAHICGFQTYAHRALRGSISEHPEHVMAFLKILSEDIYQKSQADFTVMGKMKVLENGNIGPLMAWDVPYFTQKAKKDWFRVSTKEYSPYFSLGACMDGLNTVFEALYGVQLVISELSPGECWSPDVYKLSVIHESEGLLGYIYCDFYERTGKPNQDCHFTIRGGRELSNGDYQQPIVVLMLNLPAPRWSSPSLLSPSMVDNLFHEMGHAMHSMLARTKYQHVSGTRCSTDFAEVPSILMEYFASDHRILRKFARHFQTQEPISEDMLQRLCASKRLFTASETQLQVFYAAIDQKYHGEHPLKGSTTEVLAETQKDFYCLPYISNTAWQLRFSHLVGYGAKYYSYLVSRALAYSIWKTYFEDDPFNRTNGQKYREECLSHGGGKNPRNLVTDFLKVAPDPTVLAKFLTNEIEYHQSQVEIVLKNHKELLS